MSRSFGVNCSSIFYNNVYGIENYIFTVVGCSMQSCCKAMNSLGDIT